MKSNDRFGFMGARTELHGYTQWGSQTPELPSRELSEGGIFPTVFRVVRQASSSAEIGVLYEWDSIKHLVDTLALSHHALAPNYEANPEALCHMAEEYIAAKKPTLVAVCFDNPDHVGHSEGHDTPAYYDKLHELDAYIARIVQAVTNAGMLDNTVFILTSDHGGIGKGHGGITLTEMETPFIISGCGIPEGKKIEGSVIQCDVAATIAHLLKAKAPQVWTGRSVLPLLR